MFICLFIFGLCYFVIVYRVEASQYYVFVLVLKHTVCVLYKVWKDCFRSIVLIYAVFRSTVSFTVTTSLLTCVVIKTHFCLLNRKGTVHGLNCCLLRVVGHNKGLAPLRHLISICQRIAWYLIHVLFQLNRVNAFLRWFSYSKYLITYTVQKY